MRKTTVREICQLIDACSRAEQRIIFDHVRKQIILHPLESEWGINAETILSAISRSSDLTLRGVRGIIAEATFADFVVPTLADKWDVQLIEGDQSYDFFLHRRTDKLPLRIQVKLQRKERQEPKLISNSRRKLLLNPPEPLYVVEVQRTRTGKRRKKVKNPKGEMLDEASVDIEETRPYRFGEFDIIAVNMHPSTGNWKRFMYTVASWLVPRPAPAEHLIEIMQPVAAITDEYWTDDVNQCIEWFLSSEIRRLYDARVQSRHDRT